MIDVQDVSHAYDGQLVLEGIDWSLEPGDHWAILGPSGAGKTTLVEILVGRTHPNRGGRILRDGRERINLAEWRREVGWLSTDLLDRVPGQQSVLDTVTAGKHSQTLKAERSGLRYTPEDRERARGRLKQVGLAGPADQSFGSLSQGERQLVLVARSLMDSPRLLVFDEPCAGLDPAARERFLESLEDLLGPEEDLSVIYVTHHVEEVLPAIPSVLALREGRVVFKGGKEKLLGSSDLEEVYGRGFKIRESDGRYWPVGTV